MHLGLIAVTLILAATSQVTQSLKSYNTGRGTIYRLDVTQDVAIEHSGNHNSLPYLLVGKHPQFPNKRSLLQFENVPRSCRVRWAVMYMYFVYAHKASWHSVQQTPYLNRKLMVHRVMRPWNERQANRDISQHGNRWSRPYLGLNNRDAQSSPQSSSGTTIYSYRPKGFVEFDVTRAVRDWRRGVPNYGVLVKVVREHVEGRGLRFASNADRDPKRHAFIHVMCDQHFVVPITLPWPTLQWTRRPNPCVYINGRRVCLEKADRP